MGKPEEALKLARKASEINPDALAMTTLGNWSFFFFVAHFFARLALTQFCSYKAVKQYESAADAWLKGVELVRGATNPHEEFEHPFWALGGLMKEQGDYLECYQYHKEGFEFVNRGPDDEKPSYENGVMKELYEVSIVRKIVRAPMVTH